MEQTKKLNTFNFYGLTDKGAYRENNEDFFSCTDTVNGYIFVVCDGIGGIQGGEEASEIAVNSIINFVSAEWKNNPFKLLKDACEYADSEIKKEALTKARKQTPGTTVVVVLLRDNKFYYAHAGDSRIYFSVGKKIFRLTNDHSYVQELVKNKVITEKQAKKHPEKNKITNGLGAFINSKIEVCKSPISPTDNNYLLLCSDGYSGAATKKDTVAILSKKSTEKKKAELLIKKAIDKGSDDNITVVLLKFFNTGNKEKYIPKKKKSIGRKKLAVIALLAFLGLLAILLFTYIFIAKTESIEIKKVFFAPIRAKGIIFIKKELEENIIIYSKNQINNSTFIDKYKTIPGTIITQQTKNKDDKTILYKYKIPVQKIINISPGVNIKSIETVYKINLIDILKANNKKELFLKLGEKINIPHYNRIK